MPKASILDLLKTKQLDAILLSSPSQIIYLTSYLGFSPVERDAFLLITDKKSYLFTNSLIVDELKNRVKGIIVIEHNRSKSFAKNIAEVIKKEKIEKLGFESNNLTVAEYLALTENISSRFVSIDISRLRSIKDDLEIANIKKACIISQKAFIQTQKLIKPGVTEQEIANIFQINVLKLGAALSFPTIVAFEQNSAIPHHLPDNTKMKKNGIILMDFGIRYNNFCSDITRTFFIGEQTKEQKEVYKVVLNSQQEAVRFIEKNLKDNQQILAAEVDKIAREYIISKGYPSIPHSLGHGIGIEVHEAPTLAPNSQDEIKGGMIFSIEPGIYLPNKFGVRIEDLYTIQDKKLVILSDSLI